MRAMSPLASALLSLAVLTAFALAAGGLWLIVRRRIYLKGALMMAMAAVLIANVLVLSV